MKQKMTIHETISITSMLFGMFFGAGNLIFPVYMGQLAGQKLIPAIIGFCVTGVGLPLLAVAALGISRSSGLAELSSRVGKGYGLFFTCALYLTIGPFFAIPRCATVPFTVAIQELLPEGASATLPLAIFSLVFFAAVLAFSLRPNGILTWIGRILNPIFLLSLGTLVIAALVSPIGDVSQIAPESAYASRAFFQGFLDGYNTMDTLAGLAFGIVVVNVIRGMGITEPNAVAGNTVRAGVSSCLLMAVIYLAVTVVGAQSRGLYDVCANGGEVLALVAHHYFGSVGAIILAVTVTFACLKTAVGLITSCAETFAVRFPKGPRYRAWAIIFCVVSFLIANLGLTAIINYSLPVLMFLYPLAITLIVLTLCGKLFGNDRAVYGWVTGCTLAAAVYDFLAALPKNVIAALRLTQVLDWIKEVLPFAKLGLGWVCPALIGLVIGLIVHFCKPRATRTAC